MTARYNPSVVEHDPAERSSWGSIGVFVVVAYGLAWLACLPLWLGGGLASPWFLVCAGIMMYTPTIAALVAAKGVERQPRVLLNLGIWPVASWARLVGFALLAMGAVLALCLAALVTSAAAGTYRFDLRTFEGARQVIEAQLRAAGQEGQPLPLPLWALVLVTLASLPINSAISSLLALGEEVGWRGFLHPRLRAKLGDLAAVVVTGVVWGVWHAPLLLLGYNYPGLPPILRLVWMSVFCIQVAAVLGWVRQRSRSVIPAAIGHGTLNAALATMALMLGASVELHTTSATLMGWGGWIIGLPVAVFLSWRGLLRPWQPSSHTVSTEGAPA